MSLNNSKTKPVPTVELIPLRHNLVAELHLRPLPPPAPYPPPPWAQPNPYATTHN
jgi:hypothetical protein